MKLLTANQQDLCFIYIFSPALFIYFLLKSGQSLGGSYKWQFMVLSDRALIVNPSQEASCITACPLLLSYNNYKSLQLPEEEKT